MNRRVRRAAAKKARKATRSGDWGPWDKISLKEMAMVSIDPPHGLYEAHRNKAFIVLLRHVESKWGTLINIMVRPSTEKADVPWATLQRIKRELVGDVTAIEVYPTEANLVDQANMYHLWVLPMEMELPFSL